MARTPTPANAGATNNEQTPPATNGEGSEQTPPVTNDDHADRTGTDEHDDGETIEVRVLSIFGEHEPNSVIEIPARLVPALERDGQVDSHPDAVAYAMSLKA